MAEDQDYDDLLDQNVGEVKSSIRDLENPDYRQLLQLEREGKDRKTIKGFLEPRLGEPIEEETDDEVEELTEDETEEIVEEIEEETSKGLLGSFSRESLLASGVVLGLLIGLVIGSLALGTTSQGMVSQGEVESSITELFTASGMDASQLEIAEYTQQNGMHYVTVNMTQQAGNETQTSSRSYFVSPDGELLFPELQSQLVQTPINIEQTLQQLETRQTQTTENTTQ